MLELYLSETCPYCVKVMSFFKRESVAYVAKSTTTPGVRDELMRLGGKTQVPFLVDTGRGVKMYESDDIIEYVREHYLQNR